MQKSFLQFASYGLGGGLAFILTTISLTFLTETVGWHYLLAAIVGYGLGFLVNFTFQLLVTFRPGSNRLATRLIRFALIQLLGFMLFVGLIAFLVNILSLHYLFAYFTTVIIIFVLNFTLSKRFAFATPSVTSPQT